MAAATLIITRPERAAERFVQSLAADVLDRVSVIRSPLMQIVPTGAVVRFNEDEGAIFTSQAAVALAPVGGGRIAYCVGAATTKAACDAGWRAQMTGQTAQELTAALSAMIARRPLKHLSGTYTRGDIAEKLTAAGWQIADIAVYDQPLLPLNARAQTALASQTPSIVPLFSPRTAAQFATSARKLRATTIIALSAAVAGPVGKLEGANVLTLSQPDAGLMRSTVENVCRDFSLS